MRKLLKLSMLCVAGALVFAANPKTAFAYEEGVAGFVFDKDLDSSSSSDKASISSLSTQETPIPGYDKIGIAHVEKKSNLLIRKGAGTNQKIIGKLPNNGGCEIIGKKGAWSKIVTDTDTGTIKGYVKSEYLIKGDEALRLAKKVGSYVVEAKKNVDGLRVRKKATTNSKVVDTIAEGEELVVVDSAVHSSDKDYSKWVKVSLDNDENANDAAYIAKDYVDISYELVHAVPIKKLKKVKGTSSVRTRLIDMARDHLGEAYVWGGTRLGVGVDCSGFVQALYRNMGYSISRTSRSQACGGSTVSRSSLKPGDLVFYGSSRYISHVAMYIGNGQIIHASNRRDGIKISNMNYRSPVKYVRYIRN